eukprot:9503313-Pyramimonas_sp.AAC.1
MPVDCPTKDDISKGNAALSSLLAIGKLVLIDEASEISRRKDQPGSKDRSQAASRRMSDQDSRLISWADFQSSPAVSESGDPGSPSPSPPSLSSP